MAKRHIKKGGAREFEGRSYSSLEGHERKRGKLLSPLNAAFGAKTQMTSWRDLALNEMLWAVVLRGNMEQTGCISAFRIFLKNANDNLPDKTNTFITHSALSVLPESAFDILIAPLLSIDPVKELLRTLLLIDCLPDRSQWARHLKAPDPETHSRYLLRAIASCTDHQSQESTDVRWLKLFYFTFICDRLKFALEDADRSQEKVREMLHYPGYGDQRAVRPSIRASEIMLRSSSRGDNIPNEIPEALRAKIPVPWHEEFWRECLKKSPCMPADRKKPDAIDDLGYIEQLVNLLEEVSEHFLSTLENTDVDARRDAAFGLTLYAITLAIGLQHVCQRADGRLALRCIVEAFITLKFLVAKDNPTLWVQFRNFGSGQAKLAFLKNLREDEVPSFIRLRDLEHYASEDMWQEYVDIDLKSWSDRNLRSMSEEVGVKDVYDNYYDWSSGYVHARWGAIRESVFSICLNPLHRHHRIPGVPRFDMPSVIPDASKLVNRMLDLLNETFPPFKARIKHQFKGETGTAGESGDEE